VGDTDVMAVVKANAYGHGDVEVSWALRKEGVKHFGVAMVEEGIRLRENGVKEEIYILSGINRGDEEAVVDYNFIPLISDIDTARRISKFASKRKKIQNIHIKVDTGMGRLGFLPWEMDTFFYQCNKLGNVRISGIASHLADLAEMDMEFTKRQIQLFNNTVALGVRRGITFTRIHIANSAGVFLLPQAHFNLVRPGIALYGYPPFNGCREDLRPVMTLKTKILYLKRVPPGYSISYGRTFFTRRESLIATIPAGYADGLNRLLSNKGEVLVKGKRAPIVGRVCMDLTMIDVTDVKGVRPGDEVTIIGTQGKETITALEIARKIDTISYEVLCSISSRIHRRYINR